MNDLNAVVKEVYIEGLKGKKYILTGSKPAAQIESIRIYEGIDMPTMAAELTLIDTATNLIASAPIVGTEKVVMKIQVPSISQTEYKYEFVIYGIRNRIVSKNAQMYILDLFTMEALKNEVLRIGKKVEGTGDTIVKDILSNYLEAGSKIKSSNFETCKYKIKEIPSMKRPFDMIASLLPECVSSAANPQQQAAASKTTKSNNPGSIKSDVPDTAKVISGSAGYMFFETYEGYVFKSIDKLVSDPEKHKEYAYSIAQTPESNTENNAYKILNYSFGSQENILQKMRYGVYGSVISFFNPSTLEYEEYKFSLEKEYQQMKHLGTDEKIPDQIKNFSQYPSRVMLQFYDHETFHSGTDIADPTQSSGGQATPYPDFKKQWMAQSISRSMIMKNQILNITIPLNLELRAGDKLKVKLPNQSLSSEREKDLFDKTNSGVYLISKISYEVLRDNSKGLIAVSNVELIRDNLGS
jgi:hypothetical protein